MLILFLHQGSATKFDIADITFTVDGGEGPVPIILDIPLEVTDQDGDTSEGSLPIAITPLISDDQIISNEVPLDTTDPTFVKISDTDNSYTLVRTNVPGPGGEKRIYV